MNTAVVRFRQDLRLNDNPALFYAARENDYIIPLYILDDSIAPLGKAQQWWLHHSLLSLQKQLDRFDVKLILKKGNAIDVILKLCKQYKVSSVYWNRCYEPAAIVQENKLKEELFYLGTEAQDFQANLLFEPWDIVNQQGDYYKIFTPFWRQYCLRHVDNRLFRSPKLVRHALQINSDKLDSWKLLPTKPDWSHGLAETWQPGEAGAQQLLKKFISDNLSDYAKFRDFPAKDVTSRLSPHLHFGEISPKQIWNAVKSVSDDESFLRQLIWREFSYYILFHFPKFAEKNYQKTFDDFPWIKNKKFLSSWQKGETGYPIVDAGMRELWYSGYMHNRVRMITASFLTKDLLIDWRKGAAWFLDTLVDADLANNSMGWQWVAGTGLDAAPYFRIFNPVLQGKKFDPQGDYIRRWIPELSQVPKQFIHEPWKATEKITNYPKRIIDHDSARKKALELYQSLKKFL